MNMPTPEHQGYVPVSAGAQLRAYRENAQLTVDDVAHHLKLARRQVLAIENDELDALPGPTFARGFIRNYARLLRIDPTPLLEASNLVAPSTAAIENIAPTRAELPATEYRQSSWTRWLIPFGLVLVLVAGLAFYEFGDVPNGMRKVRKEPPETVVAMPAVPAPSTAAPSSSGDVAGTTAAAGGFTSVNPPEPAAPTVAVTDSAQQSPTVQDAPKEATQPEAQLAIGTGRIELSLSGPSWIEIKDARGEVLLSRILPSGAQQAVTGGMPLSVKIGNAGAVQLKFNGSPVELAPYTQREVARLTLPPTRR